MSQLKFEEKYIAEVKADAKKFLNVGGGPKGSNITKEYDGWNEVRLDIDPLVNPDVVCDARELSSLPEKEYDAVYCSHNLEHYFRHDALKVLKGFMHVLKDDGIVHIRVPDIQKVMEHVVKNNMDIGDVLYYSGVGPIKVRDVIYGLESQIESSGQDYYAHKTGFSHKSLEELLRQAGFPYVGIGVGGADFEIVALGFKNPPTDEIKKLFKISFNA